MFYDTKFGSPILARNPSNLSTYFQVTNAGNMELGPTDAAQVTFVDFHSSGNVNDYDCRIFSSGGSSTVVVPVEPGRMAPVNVLGISPASPAALWAIDVALSVAAPGRSWYAGLRMFAAASCWACACVAA